MILYWRSQGKSLLEHLDDMYKEYGYYEDRAISKNFPGSSGVAVMKGIMAKLRTEGLKTLGGEKVVKIRDVQESVVFDPANPSAKTAITLPKSNVLQFYLESGTIVSARPSGTEPKIKFYINSVIPAGDGSDEWLKDAKAKAGTFCNAIESDINSILDAASK